ncbi:unnamed protein product [Pylaiella littoralis]
MTLRTKHNILENNIDGMCTSTKYSSFPLLYVTQLLSTHRHVRGAYLPSNRNVPRRSDGLLPQTGFTGAIGSTDVTHVGWGMCPFTLGRSFTGKEGFPTLAFEVTVDHAGRAIGVTQGFTGATNDKTIVRYDAAVQTIRNNKV